MRFRLAIVLLGFVVVAMSQPTVGQNQPAQDRLPDFGPPAGWPDRHPVPDPLPPSGPQPLPKASLTEPFAIGEALHDPERVEDAVVSLLALMDITIVPNDPPMRPVPGRTRIRLPESEVRELIAMGTADALAQAEDPSGPHTFADVHTAMGSLLPDISVESLAEAYRAEYERRPESLAPMVLLGRPLEPDTALLRTEMWLLVADALAPMGASPRARFSTTPRLVPVRMILNQNPGDWLPFPGHTPGMNLTNAEWREMVIRLPLVADEHSITMTSAQAHEGHGGPGAPVTLKAQLTGTPRPVVSSVTGRVLLVPRPGRLAGVQSYWDYGDEALRHGTMSIPHDSSIYLDADGVGRVTYSPKPERANGRGGLLSDNFWVNVMISRREVVDRLYAVPAGLASPAWSELRAWGSLVQTTDVPVQWHGGAIEVSLTNVYDVGTVAAFGLTRMGVDVAKGTLEMEEDETTFRGEVRLVAFGRANVPGMACRLYGLAEQYAEGVGTIIDRNASRNVAGFYNEVHKAAGYRWLRGQPDTYMRLEFFPKSSGAYQPKDPCQEPIQRTGSTQASRPFKFIPLNDAQWTVPHTGYPIAVPAVGETLRYEDRTSENANLTTSPRFGGRDLSGLIKAKSIWYVTVTRLKEVQ